MFFFPSNANSLKCRRVGPCTRRSNRIPRGKDRPYEVFKDRSADAPGKNLYIGSRYFQITRWGFSSARSLKRPWVSNRTFALRWLLELRARTTTRTLVMVGIELHAVSAARRSSGIRSFGILLARTGVPMHLGTVVEESNLESLTVRLGLPPRALAPSLVASADETLHGAGVAEATPMQWPDRPSKIFCIQSRNVSSGSLFV